MGLQVQRSSHTIPRDAMAAQPNLPHFARFAYVIAGAALVWWGFFRTDSDWLHYLLPILGGILLIEGIIGYCMACAAFGIGKKAGT